MAFFALGSLRQSSCPLDELDTDTLDDATLDETDEDALTAEELWVLDPTALLVDEEAFGPLPAPLLAALPPTPGPGCCS